MLKLLQVLQYFILNLTRQCYILPLSCMHLKEIKRKVLSYTYSLVSYMMLLIPLQCIPFEFPSDIISLQPKGSADPLICSKKATVSVSPAPPPSPNTHYTLWPGAMLSLLSKHMPFLMLSLWLN